jgi:K+-sensing histidine kinase KdpD
MQAIASSRGPSEVLHAAAEQIKAVFGLDITVLVASETGALVKQLEPDGFSFDDSLLGAAENVFTAAQNGAIGREGALLPLRAAEEVIAVIALTPAQVLARLSRDKDVMLNAMAGQVALAMKRAALEERAREAERKQQYAKTAKAEAVATLAGGLAHDLNNLLTGMLGNASLVADSLPVHHPSRKLLSALNMAGERAAHIVAQVLSPILEKAGSSTNSSMFLPWLATL